MPELPEMQALAERLEAAAGGRTLESVEPLGFAALKTYAPAPDELVGRKLEGVGRRAKYVLLRFDGSCRECPSSAVTLELAVRDAIRTAAPEIETVEVVTVDWR